MEEMVSIRGVAAHKSRRLVRDRKWAQVEQLIAVVCKDQALTIGSQVLLAAKNGGRVIVFDLSSTDETARIAAEAGAEVIICSSPGEALVRASAEAASAGAGVMVVLAGLLFFPAQELAMLSTAMSGRGADCAMTEGPAPALIEGWRALILLSAAGAAVVSSSAPQPTALAVSKLVERAGLNVYLHRTNEQAMGSFRIPRSELLVQARLLVRDLLFFAHPVPSYLLYGTVMLAAGLFFLSTGRFLFTLPDPAGLALLEAGLFVAALGIVLLTTALLINSLVRVPRNCR